MITGSNNFSDYRSIKTMYSWQAFHNSYMTLELWVIQDMPYLEQNWHVTTASGRQIPVLPICTHDIKSLLSLITSGVSTLPGSPGRMGAELSLPVPAQWVHPALWDRHGVFASRQTHITLSRHHFPQSRTASGCFWLLPCWSFLERLNISEQGMFERRKDAGDDSQLRLPHKHTHPLHRFCQEQEHPTWCSITWQS